MKMKGLRKKIRRLEKRLREGPQKLAKLKRRLEAAEAAKALNAARKSAARAAAVLIAEAMMPAAQESEEKTESLAGTSRATCSRHESQVGCQKSRPGEYGGTAPTGAGKQARRRLNRRTPRCTVVCPSGADQVNSCQS
jgi:hypothetical protein